MTEHFKDLIIEYHRIKNLDDNSLLKEFETCIRNGADHNYLTFTYLRKELLKRMEFGELI